MIRRDIRRMGDGSVKTYIRVTEGYRPAPGKPPKQRTLKSFGYLEDQADPEAFMREVKAFDANPDNREQVSSNKMYSGENRKYNYGYKYLESVYNALEIEGFIKEYATDAGFRGNYSLNEVFKLLVLTRILAPASKRASTQRQSAFYGWDPQLEVSDVYRALDHIAKFSAAIQQHLPN